jgi:hypothetical protein
MKFLRLCYYIFIIAIFPASKIFCQADTAFDGISYAQQVIGKPLSSIKDSLFDDYLNFVKNPVHKKNAVTIFSCSPSDKNILYINNIKFQSFGIVVDTTGIIKGIHFLKGYYSKSPAHDKKLFNTEYKSLTTYLDGILQLRGIKQPLVDEKSYTQERITWEKEFLKYILFNQQSKKIKKVRPFYDIDLEIFNARLIR